RPTVCRPCRRWSSRPPTRRSCAQAPSSKPDRRPRSRNGPQDGGACCLCSCCCSSCSQPRRSWSGACGAASPGLALSLRKRELLNLIVVGLLTALGFASVFIARQAVVSAGSLSYAAFFFALYLTAHVIARLAVPYADPYLLPMAG